MKRLFALPVLLALAFTGCTTYQAERDTTQPMKLRKSAFQDGGEWYMNTTVIDAPMEAGHTFPGETGGYFGINKIRWVVEQNYLYAYRTYEMIRDSDMAASRDDYLGAPVAAYRIQGHFDVWHQYNPVTGEKMPVLYEASERPWWEREWMRVDWSTNHINAFNWLFSEICKLDGSLRTDPVSYYPTQPDDPEQFYVATRAAGEEECANEYNGVWVEDERSGGYCNVYGWDNIEELETFDYIDVVNREFVHMNIMGYLNLRCVAYPHFPLDGGMQVTFRHSFMRLEDRNYKPMFMPEKAFERYGYFRLEREVYDAEYGTRDMKDEFANRWNIWQAHTDAAGNLIPKRQREIKPIIYYYVPTERLPSKEACEQGDERFCAEYVADELYDMAAAEWNESFRNTLRAVGHPEANTADVVVARPIDYRCGPRGSNGEEGGLPCQNMGDLRYSHLWNHDHVYSGAPGGYGPPLVDPETGEIVAAAANVYGGWWRRYSGMLKEFYDLSKGDLTELEILTGENVREYFANMSGNVMPPQMPIVNLEVLSNMPSRAARGELATTDVNSLTLPELNFKRDLDELKRSVGSDMDRRQALVGSSLERRLIPQELRLLHGVGPDTALTEDVLDRVSPFRETSRLHLQMEEEETFFGKRFVCFRDAAQIFDNPNYPMLFEWAEEQLLAMGEPIDRTTVVDYVLKRFWVHTAVHELGHTLGIRHQFESHFDEEHFHPEYWEILSRLPHIDMGHQQGNDFISDYDLDGDGVLSMDEYELYKADYLERRREQMEAGIELYRYTSIMDYLEGLHGGLMGIGRWDNAAIKFGYGGTVELYSDDESLFDSATVAAAGGWDDFVFQKSNRINVNYYLGGDRCNSNSDCPHAGHVRVPQRCRASRGIGSPLTNGTPEDLGVCSSIWFELEERERTQDNVFPNYRFCSDERVRDRPFCARGASGISAQEMVQNAIERYEWNYIFTNFRRYRGDSFQPYFYFSRLWSSVYSPIGKINQSLLYNYYYGDGFTENTGPGGMLDTFMATRNGLNFFAKVLATPDVGSYIAFDPNDNLYDGSYSELHASWADFYVPIGLGKYMWTAFEDGYFGQLYRYARIGTFYDKIFALEALSTRDWGQVQANDETYPINYYDAFQDEMLDLFTGLVAGDMRRYAPVIREVDDDKVVRSLEYRDFWKGGFFGTDTQDFRGLEAVYGDDQQWRYEGEDILDAGGSVWIRIYALLFALFDFNPWFDANFPSYVQLYSFGRPSAKDVEEINEGEADGTLSVYRSPDRDLIYVSPRVAGDRAIFVPLLDRANEQAEKMLGLRERVENEDWAGFVSQNAICTNILGIRDSNPETDRECLLWVANREESQLDSMESYLSVATELLTVLGYTR